MPLRLSFVLYMVVTALAATAVCALIINGLDNTRIELYYKYRDQAEQIPIPEGGHAEYSTATRTTPRSTSYTTRTTTPWTAAASPMTRAAW